MDQQLIKAFFPFDHPVITAAGDKATKSVFKVFFVAIYYPHRH